MAHSPVVVFLQKIQDCSLRDRLCCMALVELL